MSPPKSHQHPPSSEPEQMGFMFQRVCMKEASACSSPLAVERCWGHACHGGDTHTRVTGGHDGCLCL